MSKKKKQSKKGSDPRLAGDMPTAVSAEFTPAIEPDLPAAGPYNASENFDFIPDLKDNKFS